MSLYNMIHGTPSPKVEELLTKWAGIEALDFPRFRDIYISSKEPKVIVLTRTGGGNREEYEEQNEACTQVPTYLKDKDCDWDCTHAKFIYSILPEYIEDWKAECSKQ